MQKRKSRIELRGFVLVLVALAWQAGILLDAFLGAWAPVPSFALLSGAALCLLSALVFWRSSQIRLMSLLACLLLLGAWRYALVSPVGDRSAISAFTGAKKLQMTGSITEEPKLQAHSRLFIVSVNTISLNNGVTWQNVRGLVDVQMPGNALDDPYGAQYGDSVELQGNLQPPSPTSGPNIFASMIFPRLAIIQSGGNARPRRNSSLPSYSYSHRSDESAHRSDVRFPVPGHGSCGYRKPRWLEPELVQCRHPVSPHS
jgi:hypothetical protein